MKEEGLVVDMNKVLYRLARKEQNMTGKTSQK